EEAFGKRDLDKILEVARDEFPPDVSPGDEFDAEDADGGSVTLVVLDVDADRVVIDANHPLAGQTVTLQLQVEAVRPALMAEIEEAARFLEQCQNPATSLIPAARLLRRPSASQLADTALDRGASAEVDTTQSSVLEESERSSSSS